MLNFFNTNFKTFALYEIRYHLASFKVLVALLLRGTLHFPFLGNNGNFFFQRCFFTFLLIQVDF